ncbi:hypothetical protein TNIN_251441 [Trichonephila inaurata madagascariensis]|uniref:Uncharacterized protein n=1 Tax=Trichonephila inaurata madagascariensis TaxID=2747483 RepID=A0A8X6XX59_9ARAC|nr:hypothetical protein TNIN_251441 [Trichonephila inaurata madagascariensis]
MDGKKFSFQLDLQSYFFSLFSELRKTTQRHSSKRKANRRFVVIRTCGGADENLFLPLDAVSSPTDACCQTFPPDSRDSEAGQVGLEVGEKSNLRMRLIMDVNHWPTAGERLAEKITRG